MKLYVEYILNCDGTIVCARHPVINEENHTAESHTFGGRLLLDNLVDHGITALRSPSIII